MIVEVDLNICMAYELDADLYIMLVLLSKKQFDKAREFFASDYKITEMLDQLVARKYLALNSFGIRGNMSEYKIVFMPQVSKSSFDKWFEELLSVYPKKVTRIDGSEGPLFGRLTTAKELYRKATKGNKDVHRHIIKCLKFQLEYLSKRPNGLAYMKGLYRWIAEETWRDYEELVNKIEVINTGTYTDDIINEEADYGGRII